MTETPEKKKTINVPRVLVIGTNRGIGVSTLVLGLVVALRRRSVGVGTAKIGCSLSETTHHRRVMSRLAYSLDPWMLSEKQFLESLARLAGGTEIGIFEGSGGIFDPLGDDCSFVTQGEMARALGVPIILVVDARGYGDSIAAHIFGFSQYDPEVRIAGVIANRVKDAEHNELIRAAVESLNGPRYLGGVAVGDPHQTGGTLVGLQMYNPSALTRNRVIGTGNLIESGVDLDGLRQIGEKARVLPVDFELPTTTNRVCKVAVADDQAFHLTVQDNLDLIRRAGAELVAFSPIADRKIPAGSAGLYLPGGYVHLYAADLNGNRLMLKAIREFVEAGGVIYAEGASLAYLSKKITLFNGSTFDMAGVIPAAATAIIDDADPPQILYQDVVTCAESVVGPAGLACRAFRDNRWAFRLEAPVQNCFEVRERFAEGEEDIVVLDGFSTRASILGTRLNVHWGSCPELARNFIAAVSASPLNKTA